MLTAAILLSSSGCRRLHLWAKHQPLDCSSASEVTSMSVRYVSTRLVAGALARLAQANGRMRGVHSPCSSYG